MTTDEALEKVRAHVQGCRESGETDLRGILSMIRYLREDLKKEPVTEPPKETPEAIWNDMMKEAKDCRRTWGMGFPVLSMFLLRKYWKRATGWLPPEEGT